MKTIKDQFASYDIAKEVRDLGFDEECLGFYYEHIKTGFIIEIRKVQINQLSKYDVLAPLWSQIIDWFREKHSLYIDIRYPEYEGGVHYAFLIWKMYSEEYIGSGYTNDYFESREAAILKAIELIKNK